MKFAECVQATVRLFQESHLDSPRVDAEFLIAECAGMRRSELAFRAQEEIPPELYEKIHTLARRRAAHEPLQYLLGNAPFMDLDLEVTPDVLIPRPETELLAEWCIRQLPPGGRMLDLGCGSGAIALSVAAARPDCRIVGADISPAALAVAERNCERCGLRANVQLILSDMYSAVSGRFSLIAANLPYVTEEEYPTLMPEVRDHEPKLALTAPDEGFALIQKSVEDAGTVLLPGGKMIFELAPEQTQRLRELLATCGYVQINTIQDYTGRERFVTAQRSL